MLEINSRLLPQRLFGLLALGDVKCNADRIFFLAKLKVIGAQFDINVIYLSSVSGWTRS